MNTLLTVTCFKRKENESAYSIDLGQDILDGVSDVERDIMACESKVIKVQSPLRKMESLDAIQTHLRKTYPDAEVTVGIVKEKSALSQLKALEKIIGKDALKDMLEQKMNENAS